jgi:hypothetical protein
MQDNEQRTRLVAPDSIPDAPCHFFMDLACAAVDAACKKHRREVALRSAEPRSVASIVGDVFDAGLTPARDVCFRLGYDPDYRVGSKVAKTLGIRYD